MPVYNTYLRKDPFSSFSQLTTNPSFYKNVLNPILLSFSKPIQGHGTEHLSPEYSIAMFINALLGYSPNVGTQILENRLSSILKDDLRHFVKDTRVLPHPSQMTKHARTFSMEEANTIFLNFNKTILLYLFNAGTIPKRLKIAFDFKKKLYYGDKEDSHVIGTKAEKGTTKANFWHTCAIVLKGRELHVGSEMVEKRGDKEIFIKKMVEYFKSLGFIVETSVLDKEYYTKEIIDYLSSEKISYIIPVKESETLRLKKEEALKNPRKRVQEHQIKGKHVKGKGYSPVKFKIGFYAKKKLRFDSLRAKYNKNEKNVTKILTDIFVLATNQEISLPTSQKKYKFYKVRSDYGDRWRIEVTYRESIPFFTYTTSKNPEVRNLYFVIALFLYNLWVIANLFLHGKKPWVSKEPKAFFCVYLHDILLSYLQVHVGRTPPSSSFCREKELKTMGCFIL